MEFENFLPKSGSSVACKKFLGKVGSFCKISLREGVDNSIPGWWTIK